MSFNIMRINYKEGCSLAKTYNLVVGSHVDHIIAAAVGIHDTASYFGLGPCQVQHEGNLRSLACQHGRFLPEFLPFHAHPELTTAHIALSVHDLCQ